MDLYDLILNHLPKESGKLVTLSTPQVPNYSISEIEMTLKQLEANGYLEFKKIAIGMWQLYTM